jgi:PKD repeat protein
VVRIDDFVRLVRDAAHDEPELAADFAVDPTAPVAGTPVHFEDRSSGGPESWSWDFGDGTTSAEQNPVHVFDLAGTYQVELRVGRGQSTD